MSRRKAATVEKENHARQNCEVWAASIVEMVTSLECDRDRLEELRQERADLEEAITLAEGQARDAAHAELTRWKNKNDEELTQLIADATIEGDEYASAEAVRERIQESPLSIQVRSGWTNSGEVMEAEEFEILLSTGGPALRIRGELDEHKQPYRAWLEHQDWHTPWTEYHGDKIEGATLLTFCQQFYFGE